MHPNAANTSGPATSTVNSNMATFGIEGITNGTSNTAALSERLLGTSDYGNSGIGPGQTNLALRGTWLTNVSITLDQGGTAGAQVAQALYQACNSISGTQTIYGGGCCGSSLFWNSLTWNGTVWYSIVFNSYNHWNTPNKLSCVASNSGDPWSGTPQDAITAASNHPGGVNVCFCDGSVHFIKDSIRVQTWWALGSRNVGEVISSDSY
jgi:prepilin-type processing-associated H-X9-DG protein